MKYSQGNYFYDNIHKKDFPFDVQFELTYKCNLKCLHCYCSDGSLKGPELSTRAVKKILDKLYQSQCLWLAFTGGEPLMRPDFLDIYAYAKKKGFLVTIFTNGTLLDEKILSYLRRYPPYGIELTLNGITSGTYEKITQSEGVFSRLLSNIKLMREYGLPLIIKTNLMTLNQKEFPKIKKWVLSFLKKNPGTYPFKYDFMIYPRVDGDLAPLQYRLSVEALSKILKKDSDVWKQYKAEMHKDFPLKDNDESLLYSCNGWKGQLNIDPYGKLKFCQFSSRFEVDLKTASFQKAFGKISSNVKNVRFKTSSKCRVCSLRPICYWCPARALLETGCEEKPVAYYCSMANAMADMTRRLRGAKGEEKT